MRVYHLNDAKHSLNNIALWRIKVSRFTDLNDPFELIGVNRMDRGLRKGILSTREQLNDNRGLLCFSKAWVNPVLWSHYADKHRGICLGFDIPDNLLTEVKYRKSPLPTINPKTGELFDSEELMSELLRTKFADWKYEDEVRQFIDLDHCTKEDGLYFESFSEKIRLQEIILGPRCELSIQNIRSLAAIYPYKIQVTKARIAFSKFKVMPDRIASNQY